MVFELLGCRIPDCGEGESHSGNMWISGNTLYINTPKLAGEIAMVEVFNTSGQKLMSKTIFLSELSLLMCKTVNLNIFIEAVFVFLFLL